MPFIQVHKAFLPILLLLGLGLAVRLAMLPLMLYDFDEGIAGIYALQFVVKGQFPLHGIRTSLGFHNPPFFIWLVSLPAALSRNPMLAVALFHVLTIAAVGGLAWQLHRGGYRAVAGAVALFGALAPGALLLEHRMWGHALIPAISTAVVSGVWRLGNRPGSRLASFAIPILIAAAQQSHFSGALFVFSAAIVTIWCGLRFSLPWLLAGAAAAAAMYVPWVVYDAQNGWVNLRTINDILRSGSDSTPDRTLFFRAILYSLTDFGSVTAFSADGYTRWRGFLPWIVPYQIAGLVVLVAGAVAALRRLTGRGEPTEVPSTDRLLIAAALTWTTIPILAFGLLRVQPVPGYWLPALPGPWLLAGLAAQWAPRPRPILAPALALFFALASVAWLLGYAAILYRGDARYQQYPAFRDQLAAIFYISRSTQAQPYYLRQELRTQASGLDYNLLYLLAWAEGNGTRLRPINPPPDHLEVIYHNSALPWPAHEATARAEYHFIRFGLIHVLMQQKNQRQPTLSLTELH